MDKNAIKKYAVWAREELIEKVTAKAVENGIIAGQEMNEKLESINGEVLSDTRKKQRLALIKKIKEDGYDQVMEEVAYTWFNRFVAIRFMEVNGYLPSHVRVFSDENGNFNPQIMSEAIHLDIDGLDMEHVLELKTESKDDELFKYLLKVQCNALNDILPKMFSKLEDYTELLLPDYLLREGSVIEKLVNDIPEDNFDVNTDNGQIEIIGWMYQYYISAKHEEVVDPLHGKIVKKEEVPAATQLFTTDWVVRYLIDNSVGRYWIERNPESQLVKALDYYIPSKDGKIRYINETITPQDVTVLDPCVGSGHFLVYAFEVLMKIYVEYGFSERDAASEIVKNNIFGLDLDGRATQLAYFAVMMKARQYDRRFFSRKVQPHIFEIQESNSIDVTSVQHFFEGDEKLEKDILSIMNSLRDAKEYGSLIELPEIDLERITTRFEKIKEEINIYKSYLLGPFKNLIEPVYVLCRKYTVVATNPPYMNKYDAKLKEFINSKYKDYAGDLFSVFMYRNYGFCKKDGFVSFMTPNSWIAAKLYGKLRSYMLDCKTIVSLIQMAKGAFFKEATVDICAFVVKNTKEDVAGQYIRLDGFKGDMEYQREKVDEALTDLNCGYYFETMASGFDAIPGRPLSYWLSDEGLSAFKRGSIGDIAETKQGFKTGNNDRFLKLWFEISLEKLFVGNDKEKKKWFPCNKGGDYRKWYGNKEYVVDWENDGFDIVNYKDDKGKQLSRPQNLQYNFREALTWSTLSSGPISFRYSNSNMMFESKGSGCFPKKADLNIYDLQGFLNSKVTMYYLAALAPTVDYSEGSIVKLPYWVDVVREGSVTQLVKENIAFAKDDWDSYEVSWDFETHPLVKLARSGRKTRISDCFDEWKLSCENRFNNLKVNEEQLNSIYIKEYGLEKELSPSIDEKDVTIRKADLYDCISSFISYSVGCMFGRYSLDCPGLIYAGGEWNEDKYRTFIPDKDSIIPICDDEYFDDDIVGRFVEFVEVVYGKDSLEDNLQFIADAIGGKGSAREVIRSYFINDFYAYHLKTYQKRPIYWMFESGKNNGFKCLVYMHRYQPDTIARIRTDYVHEQQARYRTAIEETGARIENSSDSDKVKLAKKLNNLKAQNDEIHVYEEKIHHLADQMISIDLDDGVKKNYEIFKDVLAKIK